MTGFFVDLTITGTVLGPDHTSTPEAVHAVFGGEHTPPVDDFGLVEFGWAGREVAYFGAQAHRLPWLAGEIEPVLVERHGEFPARLDVDELREAVAAQGFPIEEQPHVDERFNSYTQHLLGLADVERGRGFDRRADGSATGGAVSPARWPAGPAARLTPPASGGSSGWHCTGPPPRAACTRPTRPPRPRSSCCSPRDSNPTTPFAAGSTP